MKSFWKVISRNFALFGNLKTKLETRTYNLCTKIEIDDTFDDKEGCKSL